MMSDRGANLGEGDAEAGAGNDAFPPRARNLLSNAAMDSATDTRHSCETAASPPADALSEEGEADDGGGIG